MDFNISICLLILKVLFLILYKHKLIILVVVPLVYKYKNKLYKTYFPKLYMYRDLSLHLPFKSVGNSLLHYLDLLLKYNLEHVACMGLG